MDELRERRQKLTEILSSVGPLMMEGYSTTPGNDPRRAQLLSTETKSGPKDLVTQFDKRVEESLLAKFAEVFPGEKALGEESFASQKLNPEAVINDSKKTGLWIFDPIDGTTNYAKAYPFFCTTAAYVIWNSKQKVFEAQISATFNPVSGEMFSAHRGGGAWLGRQRLKINDEVSDPQKALFITGFASERSQSGVRSFELFKKITQLSLGVRRDGSAALDLAYVASGRVEGYWEWGLAPWDIASGALLVEEAGGVISRLNGDTLQLSQGDIVASTPRLHKWLLSRIEEIVNESARH